MENHTNGLRKSTKRPPAANVTQRYSTEFTLEAPVQARGALRYVYTRKVSVTAITERTAVGAAAAFAVRWK
eukprot:3600488-Prymnesium_polylepis.1